MRSRALGLRIILFACLAGSAGAQEPEKAPDLARHLPADTLVYVTLPDVATSVREFDQTSLAKILAEEEVQSFIAPLLEVWSRMELDAARGMGFDFARLKNIELIRASFALTHLQLPPSRVDDIGFILELEVKKGQDDLEGLLEAAISSAKASERDVEHRRIEFEGASVQFFGTEAEGGLYWTRPTPNRFVWTTSRNLIERVITGSSTGAGSLADNPDYRQSMDRVSADGDEIRSYVAIGKMIQLGGTLIEFGLREGGLGEYASRVPAVMDALGVSGIGGMATKSSYRGTATEMTSFVRMPSSPHGLMRLSAFEPVSLARLSLIPKEATAFTLSRIDMRHLLPAAQDVVQAIDPEWHRMMQEYLSVLQEKYVVDIQEDLLAQLGGEMIFYDSPPRGPIPFPSMVFMIGMRDSSRFHEALTKMLALAEGQVSVREVPYQGRSLHAISFNGIPLPLQPAFAYENGLLIGALDIQDLKSALRRFSGSTTSILDRPDFKRALANRPIPENAIAVQYTDTAVALESGHQLIAQVLTMPGVADELPLPLDLALLPTSDAFTKHLFGSLSFSVVEGDWVYSYAYSPLGPEVYGALGGLFGLGSLLWVSSAERPDAFTGRSAPAPRRQGEAAKAKNDLEQLAIAITFYKIDNEGRLPSQLSDLLAPSETYPDGVYAGKTLPNDPWGRRYLYRRSGGDFLLYSLGPNGLDESGQGDDITVD